MKNKNRRLELPIVLIVFLLSISNGSFDNYLGKIISIFFLIVLLLLSFATFRDAIQRNK